MDIIFTTYFTKDRRFAQHDCSRGCKPDMFNLMKKWYDSVSKLQMNAVVFHNELSKGFINKYQTENIKFEFYDEFNRPSYNDERFYCYIDYIRKHSEIKRIFCTDLFDVIFFDNPFKVMNEKYDLYLGSECNPSRTWIKRKSKEIKLKMPDFTNGETYYNAGIIGGTRKNIIKLFNLMIEVFKTLPGRYNANMPVYNYCLHQKFKGKYFTGHPLHNKFKSGKNPNGAYIKHK